MSSTAVVSKIKKILGEKHVGHLGTLDPAAGGVLVVACSKATKFFDYFLSKDKVYFAVAQFGKMTNTLDSFGTVIKSDDKLIETDAINNSIGQFVGKIQQVPPLFSAVKVGGVAAYKRARNNESVELKPREIEIFDFKLVDKIGTNTFGFYIHCSSGTYVRSLILSLAESLGTIATTPVIIRLKSGPFAIEKAVTLEELEREPQKHLISIENLFCNMKRVEFVGDDKKIVKNGGTVFAKTYDLSENAQILGYVDGKLFGLFDVTDGMAKCKINVFEE